VRASAVEKAMKKIALVLLIVVCATAVSMPLWKPTAKKHFKWLVIATNVYQDTLRRAHLRSDQISQPDFSTRPASDIPSYLNGARSTFSRYQTYGGLTDDRLRGARVLEIGPGETLAVALHLIGAGASQVVAVDKFVPLQRSSFHQALYRTLTTSLEDEARGRVAAAVDLRDGVTFDARRVSYVYGQAIEDAASTFPAESFDAIVSNAVLEEVYDLDRTLAALDRVLKPGGRQVHVIDLRDYGMFSKYGYHPLEFLTVPDSVYRFMVESVGQPNRRLVNYYRERLESLGYSSSIYTTWILGQPQQLSPFRTDIRRGVDYSDESLALVRSIRPRLLPRYRKLSDEDLIVQSIIVSAEKRRDSSGARLSTSVRSLSGRVTASRTP
jgi:SAM-dependent methyltransferase